MLDHQLIKLSSGLDVLLIPMVRSPSITSLILGNTGSRYESIDKQGIAHFFEHMVFKGTKHYPSAQSLAVAIDAVGAEANAFTSKEYTGYYIKAASTHLELALDVLSDMILLPKLVTATFLPDGFMKPSVRIHGWTKNALKLFLLKFLLQARLTTQVWHSGVLKLCKPSFGVFKQECAQP